MKSICARLKERRPPARRLRSFWRWETAYKSLAVLFSCAVLVTACETTDKTGGNQEAKRRAALERHRQQAVDQSEANLRNAQENLLNRDSNPNAAY